MRPGDEQYELGEPDDALDLRRRRRVRRRVGRRVAVGRSPVRRRLASRATRRRAYT